MRIAVATLDEMRAHAVTADPHECCGLLIGTADEIHLSMPATNRAADPTRRYEIDPQDHFAAIREARRLRMAVVGAYHSHPHSAPVPSPTDRAEAFEDFVFVIVGRSARGSLVVRGWQLLRGNFVELPLVCDR